MGRVRRKGGMSRLGLDIEESQLALQRAEGKRLGVRQLESVRIEEPGGRIVIDTTDDGGVANDAASLQFMRRRNGDALLFREVADS